MADSEDIGGISISVGADYSDLLSDFADMQTAAESAGSDVADAFTEAAGGANDYDDAVEQAGEATEETSSKLEEMAEQLAAVGEALIVTEGFRELGTEALGAADSITTATIALTNITGSADKASETIEGLEQLGMADGLSMPSLLTAAQRMSQVLPPGTEVTVLLGQIADGAAAMGTSIDSAAQRFDNIVNAGTLSARALTSLGLSLTSVSQALDEVDPAADATTDSVTAMFKELDPGQRIEVLQTALQALGGTAQEVANQTFGGQWQQLANAWEEVMVQVGQAILPVISDLVSLTKTDIVPFIQALVSDFNSLSPTVKDVAVGVALAAATVIPLTGALAALGIGVAGLQSLLPAVNALMTTLGITSATVAAQETAEVVATVAMGTAAAAAVPEVEALAAAEGTLGGAVAAELVPAVVEGTAGLVAFTTGVGASGLALMGLAPIAGLAILSIASLKDGWAQAVDTWNNATGTISAVSDKIGGLSTNTTFLGTVATDLKGVWSGLLSVFEQYNTYSLVAQGINKIADAVQLVAGVTPGAAAMTATETAQLEKLQTAGTQSAAALSALNQSYLAAGNAAGVDITQTGTLLSIYNDATAAFEKASAARMAGTITAEAYEAAVTKLTTAQKNYNDEVDSSQVALGPIPGSMEAITDAANAMATAQGFVVSATQQSEIAQLAATTGMQAATTAYDASQAKVELLAAALHDAQAANVGVTAAQQAFLTANNAAAKELSDLNNAVQAYVTYMNGSHATTQAQIDLLKTLADQFGPATAAALGLTDKIKALQDSLPAFGVQIVNLNSGPMIGLQSALAEASAKVADLSQKMQAGANVGQQYEKALTAQLNAQIAVDQESALLASGLQGLTGSTALLEAQVVEAQAKYNDLVTAWQSGLPVLSQLQAAAKALESAHAALTKAQQDGTTAAGQLTTGTQNLTTAMQAVPPAANAAAAGMTAVGSAASAANSQVDALAASVSSIASDFSTAGWGDSSGGSISAPAGYTASIQFEPGVNGGGSEVVTFIPTLATQLAQQLKADAALTPAKGDSALALAQDALAQAQATVATYQQFFGSGAVTAAQLQGAETALTTAQTALAALTSSGNLRVDPTQPITPIVTGATGSTTTSTTTPITTTASGSGTGAIDGGSYPAVTAHQAAGEVWAVSTSGASAGGATVSTGSTTDLTQTITTAVGSTNDSALAGAVGGAAQQISTVAGGLVPINTSLATIAAATQQTVETIGGILIRLNNVGTSSSPLPGVVSTTGESTVAGAPIPTAYPTGNPQGPTAGTPGTGTPAVPGYTYGGSSASPGIQVTADFRGANFGGPNATQMQAAVQSAVTAGLVQALRTAGARF